MATVIPAEPSFWGNFGAGVSAGMTEVTQRKLQMDSFRKLVQGFQEYFQGGGGGAGGQFGNPQAVYGEPSQTPAIGGIGAPQAQQNPMMQRLTQMLGGMGRGVGGMGQGIGAGLQGLGRGIGGMFGQNRQQGIAQPMGMMPPVGNPQMSQGGQMGPLAQGQGGVDPRIMAIIQQILGGRMGMF